MKAIKAVELRNVSDFFTACFPETEVGRRAAAMLWNLQPWWMHFDVGILRQAAVLSPPPKAGFRFSRPSDLPQRFIQSIVMDAMAHGELPGVIADRIRETFRRVVLIGHDKRRLEAGAEWRRIVLAAVRACQVWELGWQFPLGILVVCGFPRKRTFGIYTRSPSDAAVATLVEQSLVASVKWMRPGLLRISVARFYVPGDGFVFLRFVPLTREVSLWKKK